MKISQAAVFEGKKLERTRIVLGLRKAGLKVTDAAEADALGRERLVVIGPTVRSPQKVAKAVRSSQPDALILAAVKRISARASWADGVLPLPLSANDLKVRLPELMRLRGAPTTRPPLRPVPEPVPTVRPGDGILDPLTGFYTFAHFKEVLFIEVKRARRYKFPVSLALIAFDPLDEDLAEELRTRLHSGLALAIRSSLRDTDFPVQYDRDRISLFMPHTEPQGALIVARRICERVARAELRHGQRVLRPTLSIGVAGVGSRPDVFSFSDLVKAANEAMTAAMRAGGNRVEFSSTEAVPADERDAHAPD